MQRNHPNDNAQPNAEAQINASAHTYTQRFLNKLANVLLQKTANNKHQPVYANHDYEIALENIDHRTMRCLQNIHYADLDYIHQPRVFDCSDTSMAMLIEFYKKKLTHIELGSASVAYHEALATLEQHFKKRKIYHYQGKSFEDMVLYSSALTLRHIDKNQKPLTPAHFAYYLYEYGPLIVGVKETVGSHSILIKGMVHDQLIIHDPWSGSNIVKSFDKFLKRWEGELLFFAYGYSKKLVLEIIPTLDSSPSARI